MQLLSAGIEVHVWHCHFSTSHQPEGVSCGVFDWLATDHDLQLHRADPTEFLWQSLGAASLDLIVSGAPESPESS